MNKTIKILVGIIGFSLAAVCVGAIGDQVNPESVNPVAGIILFICAIGICAGTIVIISKID